MSNFELACLKQPRVGECTQCGVHTGELLLCPCNTVKYCTQECQKKHWDVHQPDCPYGLDLVETQVCSNCLSTGQGHYSCSCGATFYCNTTCQRQHWKEHSHVCKSRIRVLLKEAARMRANVGIQCKRKVKKMASFRQGSIRRKEAAGGEDPKLADNEQNPLGPKARRVSFDHFENSSLSVEPNRPAEDRDATTGEDTKNQQAKDAPHHHHHHHHHHKNQSDDHAFVDSDGDSSSSGSSEEMEMVESTAERPKRTASKIVKSFVAKQYRHGENDLVSESFMVDGECDENEGGAATQPPRTKIPVAVYLDLDESRKKKVHLEGHGASVTRKIVRLGVIMC